jgi:endonuclease-8
VTTSAGQRFVCFNAQDVELLRPDEVLTTSPISRLGPDLLATDCDFEAIVRRARRRCNAAPMVDTLLDQTVAAGFGNVYKSELLFLFGLYPGRLTETVDDTLIKAIYARGRDLLQQNLGGWSRTTTFDPRPTAALRAGNGPRLYVYRRRAAPCLHCQAPISRALMGKHQRSTYWCPVCQPLTGQANVLSP